MKMNKSLAIGTIATGLIFGVTTTESDAFFNTNKVSDTIINVQSLVGEWDDVEYKGISQSDTLIKLQNNIVNNINSFNNKTVKATTLNTKDVKNSFNFAFKIIDNNVENKADLNIGLKMETQPKKEYNGFAIRVLEDAPKYLKDACKQFAEEFNKETGMQLRYEDGIIDDEYFTGALDDLHLHKNEDIPSVILYMGNIMNNKDRKMYSKDSNIEEIGDVLAELIDKHFVQNKAFAKDQEIEKQKKKRF